jgi:hypothetical protein
MRSIAIPNYRLEIRKQFPQKKSAYVVLLDKEASDRRLGQAAYILAKKNRHGR